MSKLKSLIDLVNSLSKPERKKITSTINLENNHSDYVYLFKLIDKERITDVATIKEMFEKRSPNSAINISVNYLFKYLLDILRGLRENQDSYYGLFNMLMHAKVLYEKSIYPECFSLLKKAQTEAVYYENFLILMIAQKLELEYLLSLGFPELSEQELLTKQYKTNETLKKIRKINEHTSLFELLKYRILHKGDTYSFVQKQDLNDLVISEMSIVSGSGFENFEIEKNHKLFQANYLMSVGDYKAALNSFYELNHTFENNMHLLSNPPMYYLSTIEGVLESLRSTKDYESMTYFINKLKNLETPSAHFKLQIQSVVFCYSALPDIDKGRFGDARNTIDEYREELLEKADFLPPLKYCQVMFYVSIIYFGNKEYLKAKKIISGVLNKYYNTFPLPLLRSARLIYLIILFEQNDFDLIDFESRSLSRKLKKSGKVYQIESLLLRTLSKPFDNLLKKERLELWKKVEIKLAEIYSNKNERHLIEVFDFGAWLESKIMRIPFNEVLEEKFNQPQTYS